MNSNSLSLSLEEKNLLARHLANRDTGRIRRMAERSENPAIAALRGVDACDPWSSIGKAWLDGTAERKALIAEIMECTLVHQMRVGRKRDTP